MKIEMAKHSGFCMGVRNAILKIVDKLNSSDEEILVYGPLIHNPQTIKVLNDRGLKTINDFSDVDNKNVAIRTHGIPVEENKIIKSKAKKTYNLTCSRVGKVQAIIKKHSRDDYYTIIIGDKDHAEVIGLRSYAKSGITIVSDANDIPNIPLGKKYLVVSQTTHERSQFDELVGIINKKLSNVTVIDTICDSTRLRQKDVHDAILKGIDTLVVVGGKNSANTTRLAKIGKDNNINTLHIETDEELKLNDFLQSNYVFVTAGASTPGWIINNVLEKIYMFKQSKDGFFTKKVKTIFGILVRSNALSSITAFFMVFISQLFLGLELNPKFAIIAFIFIFYMYSINNYLEREFLSKSNSYKYEIYKQYGKLLLIISCIMLPISLYIAFKLGLNLFLILSSAYILGSVYSTNGIKKIIKKIKFEQVFKFYNSRVITPFGWLLVTVIMPILGNEFSIFKTISISIVLYSIIYLRQIIIDVVAFHGDFILGRETIPTWLGIKWTAISSYTLLTVSGILIVVSSLLFKNYYFNIYVFNLVYFFFLLKKTVKKNYLISLKYELFTDLNYFLLILFTIPAIILNL